MGRTKQTARRPKAPAAATEIEFDDAFPPAVLSSLLSLPPKPTSHLDPETDERSPKRRKTAVPPPEYAICVVKCQAKISRRTEDDILKNESEMRDDVGRFLAFQMRDDKLRFRSTSGSPITISPVSFPIKNGEASEHLGQLLYHWQKPAKSEAGAIWTAINLQIGRHDKDIDLEFTFHLMWNETVSPYSPLRRTANRDVSQTLIDTFFPSPHPEESAWSPMDFYDAAYIPPKDDEEASSIQVPALESTLFPYQKRTLKWLLAREGTKLNLSSHDATSADATDFDAFRTVRDADGNEIFLNDILHIVTRDKSFYQAAHSAMKGGILAEEMGLGKTLEILGLIALHKFPDSSDLEHRKDASGLIRTGATLIVSPESLREQWVTEIGRHAPTLRVMHYRGCKKYEGRTEEDILRELDTYDVIVTTYTVLSQEIHFATAPPERSRRHERVYERQISPLVKMLWWRVCLDEAQMIESGVTQAAAVARVIPRINAWAITGTPVKDDVKDLLGLLQFLWYQPFCSYTPGWNALIRGHRSIFQQLFKAISLRHTKALVRDEIMLPHQNRYVISMPFSAVEEQHYQSLYKEMAEACGFDLHGAPIVEDWAEEDYEHEMRTWLTRLRQSALHPEVGVYNRRVLGYSKERPMRTVDEVLNAMLEQSEISIRNDERSYLLSRLTRGQLYENSPRVKEARVIWEEVREETAKLVEEARSKFNSAVAEHKSHQSHLAKPVQSDDSDDSLSEDELEGIEASGKVSELRRRLRNALELHHKSVFFCANAVFQIRDNVELTEPDSDDFKALKMLEDKGYENAKVLRREILRESYRKANRHMTRIARKANTQSFTEVPELAVKSERGIESGRVIDRLEMLYAELNEQANILDEWREHVIQLSLRALLDEEDDVETTGEELADSAKIQDDLMVYVQALRSAICDRQDAISGQTNELVKHEIETSIRLAKSGGGPAPEKLLELLEMRAQLKPKLSQISMRGAIGELRGLQTRLTRDGTMSQREAIENRVVSDLLKSTQVLLNEQNKAALSLESEIESFKDAMNARLEYYRQLQVVSDAVLVYDGQKTEAAEERMKKVEADLQKKLSSAEAKHRYLLNLKEAGSKSNEPRMCVICQMPFSTGVLTVCGHQFCKECMMLWFKSHKNCPVCKKPLKQDNLHDITIKPQQLQVHNETAVRQAESSTERKHANGSRSTTIYSEFNEEKLEEIKNIELDGPSFTTKVDALVRHLLWLRESDPGAKAIVFSQYRDFLHILQTAFRRFRIGYASIDEPNGITKFKSDPAVECFLLHARAHSSGLNLVNASHVFLCEPLLNTALELQAIARVDRIGQLNETTVWLYLVSGTVEESIYNLSVQRRMEHMGRTSTKTKALLDVSIEEANTLELEHAALSKLMSKDRSAGEMVDKSDLWECLFGGQEADKRDAARGDGAMQERAVMSYLAAEAAEQRMKS